MIQTSNSNPPSGGFFVQILQRKFTSFTALLLTIDNLTNPASAGFFIAEFSM
uniref:Uncharacterized protein n=1 Tax=Enterobacteria phage Nil3 TaxID=338345 RepID=Q4A1M0_9VIRU|nr:hypothetical protein [Enterobacteria phage Nil3]